MSEPPTIYLKDQLAGAHTAVQSLEVARIQHEDQKFRQFANTLLPEIQADHHIRRSIKVKMHARPSVVKEAGGWILEKLSRVKLPLITPPEPNSSALLNLETGTFRGNIDSSQGARGSSSSIDLESNGAAVEGKESINGDESLIRYHVWQHQLPPNLGRTDHVILGLCF